MSSGKVLDKILNEIYEELYKRATPHASFKKLVKEAPWIDKDGNAPPEDKDDDWCKENGFKKDIHYKDYVISKKSAESAIDSIIGKHKKLTDYDVKVLMHNLAKGCAPLTDEEKNKLDKNNEDEG